MLVKQTSVLAISSMIGFTSIVNTDLAAPPLGFMVGVAGKVDNEGYTVATNIS